MNPIMSLLFQLGHCLKHGKYFNINPHAAEQCRIPIRQIEFKFCYFCLLIKCWGNSYIRIFSSLYITDKIIHS